MYCTNTHKLQRLQKVLNNYNIKFSDFSTKIFSGSDFSTEITKFKIEKTYITKQLNCKFMNPIIKNYVKKLKYKITFNYLWININIYTNTLQLNNMCRILNNMCRIIHGVVNIYNISDIHDIYINYYDTDFKKTLNTRTDTGANKNKNYITTLNVNSGCSYKFHGKYIIDIWRNEEYEKVLIHELIHSYKLEHTWKLHINVNRYYILHNVTNVTNVEKELKTELQTWILYLAYKNIKSVEIIKDIYHSIQNVYYIFKYSQNLNKITYPVHIYTNTSIDYYYIKKSIVIFYIYFYNISLLPILLSPTTDFNMVISIPNYVIERYFNIILKLDDLIGESQVLNTMPIPMIYEY